MSTIQQIEKILKSDFEKQLFKASLKNLEDENNSLRYHNFCYSIRELSRHFLNSLSPEDLIFNCPWFKVETDNGKPTRTQKIKYAIQGGLTDKLLEELEFDIEELKTIIKEIKLTIDSLSKYTHINPENFILTEGEIKTSSEEVLMTFENFVNTIIDYKETLKSFLDGEIEVHMINTIINNSYENIDSLAPHYSLEYGEVNEYHIEEITDKEIIVIVYGNLHVTLEYGSRSERANDDGLDISESFPFETKIKYEIIDKFPPDDYEVEEFDVDTSEWYSDDDISDEELDKLILSSIRALQGEITSSLRSVSVEMREKLIVWQCFFDSDATEDDFELMSVACAEVIADYEWGYSLEKIIKYVPVPEDMKHLKNLIYLRHEKNYYKQ